MAQAQDEQPRNRWPLNESPGLTADDPRLASRRDGGTTVAPASDGSASDGSAADGSASGETRLLQKPAVRTDTADRLPGDVDFSTYVDEALRIQRAGGATSVADRAVDQEREVAERAGPAGLYRSGEVPTREYDDAVLGLNYSTVAPRAPVTEERWASSLRTFARGAVWSLPAGVFLLALSGVFGWPTETRESALVSPGTWVVVTALGLGLWLVGVVALAALVAASRVRPWGYVAVVASTLGVALLAPVVGIVGLGRPAISRTAMTVQDDGRIAGLAGEMHNRLLDNTVGRWLIVGGGVLLVIGALAVAGTILGSRVLQRHDGWLVLLGVGIAIAAAYLSWEFLFVLAAMVILAGALGLAYTASRIAPDGSPPPAY